MPQTSSTGVVSLLTVLAFRISRMKASAVQAYAGAVYRGYLCVPLGRPPVLRGFFECGDRDMKWFLYPRHCRLPRP